MVDKSFLARKSDENEEQFLWRLGFAKDSGALDLSWEEISDVVNKEFRADESEYRTEAAYRKRYQQAKQFYEAGVFSSLTGSEYVGRIQEEKTELKKLKQQVQDERTDYQRSIREQARRESFISLVKRVMADYIEPFDYVPSPEIQSDDDMIVCLADLHTGINVNNAWNKYDTSIMAKRMHNYLDRITEIQSLHKCKRCDVVIAGDDISGWIHQNLRLENNENVVSQIKIAAIYTGEFIDALRGKFEAIRVHSVAGNHSRLSPNKEAHSKGENLDELIPFCLQLMFNGCDDVEICEDGFIDESINSFVTRAGKLVYIVHGDKDTPDNVTKNLTMMTGVKPDAIIMAHRHTNAMTTEYNTKVIQTGCVVGTDSYCVDRRIANEPEQAVVITGSSRVVKCLYDVGIG